MFEPAALVANHASIFLDLLRVLDDAVNEIFSGGIDHRHGVYNSCETPATNSICNFARRSARRATEKIRTALSARWREVQN